MKDNAQIYTKPLSKTIGQQIINANNSSILELSKESIVNLFRDRGVLLFRGFEANVEIFTKFSNELSTNFMDYTGGVFKRKVINNNSTLLSVNDFKDEVKLHGEMYYQKNIPLMLWFFCANPASQDGATIVCDGQLFFDELSDLLKDLFSQKKLKYRGHLERDAWIKRYKTDELDVVEQICKSNNTHLQINEDESIDVYYICPAIHPSRTGKSMIFINSLLPAMALASDVVSFDDGTDIDEEIICELNQIAEKITLEVNWQKGDILMVDNTRIMHGRRAFVDEKRDIYIRLCSPTFSY